MQIDKNTASLLESRRPKRSRSENRRTPISAGAAPVWRTRRRLSSRQRHVTGHDPVSGRELSANGLDPDGTPFYRIIASPLVAAGLDPWQARTSAPDAGDSTREGERQRHEPRKRRLELRTRTGRATPPGQRWNTPLHRRTNSTSLKRLDIETSASSRTVPERLKPAILQRLFHARRTAEST